MSKSVVLLSGGLDSALAMEIALEEGQSVIPLIMWVNEADVLAAKAVCGYLKQKYGKLVWSPRYARVGLLDLSATETGSDPSYIPCRNSLFLAAAFSVAERECAQEVRTGAIFNDDNAGMPDTTPEFFLAFEAAMLHGSRAGKTQPIRIVNTLIDYAKEGVLRGLINRKFPLGITRSCMKDTVRICRKCRPCTDRKRAFDSLGMKDKLQPKLQMRYANTA